MAINHLVALGKSAGAVTSGLSVVIKQLGQFRNGTAAEQDAALDFFGAADEKNKAQTDDLYERIKLGRVVILTSPEVFAGTEKYGWRDNAYCQLPEQQLDEGGNVFCKVVDFIRSECQKYKIGPPNIFYAVAGAFDLQANMQYSLSVLNWLVPRGRQGANTWVNVTGGTNIVNNALFTASYLMGTVGRVYYTFVPNEPPFLACLRPPKTDAVGQFWHNLPLLRVTPDEGLYLLLDELSKLGAGNTIEAGDLLARLSNTSPFAPIQPGSLTPEQKQENLHDFRVLYLNKLAPTYVERDAAGGNRLTKEGRDLHTFLKEQHIERKLLQGRDAKPKDKDKPEGVKSVSEGTPC